MERRLTRLGERVMPEEEEGLLELSSLFALPVRVWPLVRSPLANVDVGGG